MALYQATCIAATTLWPIPPGELDDAGMIRIGHPAIGALAPGEIVTVVWNTPNGKGLLVRSDAKVGWCDAGALKKLPFIAVDLYRKELGGKPSMTKILAMPGLHAVLLKCTQGVSYPTAWFNAYWPAIRALAGERYGDTVFRGAYQYLDFFADPTKQADYYWATVQKAGGWRSGDIIPIVDVENGSSAKQQSASAQQVIDTCTAYANRITELGGRRPMLYGGSALRDRHITDHMGCQKLWCARYTADLPSKTYVSIGWSLPEVWGWQYGGTGPAQRAKLVGYPKDVPGVGQLDISTIFAASFDELVVERVRA